MTGGGGDAPVAATRCGPVRGRARAGVHSFLGVPYAAAPTGELRFAAPQPAAPWTEVRDVVEPGLAAPQPMRELVELTHGATPPEGEDCLNLNVWAPPPGDVGRPLLVWIHGGGWTFGSPSMSPYVGERLARAADVVVVGIGYRLGSLGWLYHPDLAESPGAAAGNWGLLDALAALRWVRDNAAAFGGDPDRITVAGQSSGASSVAALLGSPASTGLFRRAVIQSPALLETGVDPAIGVEWAVALSERATGAGGFDQDALRAIPAQRIVEGHVALLGQPSFAGTRGGALPVVDPATLPAPPVERPAASAQVEVLVGTVRDESAFHFRLGRQFFEPDPKRMRQIVSRLRQPEDPDALIARHRETARAEGAAVDPNALLVRVMTAAEFVEPTRRWARARAAAGACVYLYQVDHESPAPGVGAPHMVDVPLLFGGFRDGGPGAALAGDGPATEAVSAAMIGAWAAFLHDGDPGWPPLGAQGNAPRAIFGGRHGGFRVEA